MLERGHSGTNRAKKLIVFVGRSNVGKSSTIRALTGKKVRVGKKPGSTRREYFIDLGNYLLADMAGFGHMAGQSKGFIEETKTAIVYKLEEWSSKIALSVLILDLSLFRTLYERWNNRNEIPIDVEFYSFLSEVSPRVVIAANKIDKLKKKKLDDELQFLHEKMMETVPRKKPIIVPICAKRRIGTEHLKQIINDLLSEEGLVEPEWGF